MLASYQSGPLDRCSPDRAHFLGHLEVLDDLPYAEAIIVSPEQEGHLVAEDALIARADDEHVDLEEQIAGDHFGGAQGPSRQERLEVGVP